MQKKKAVFAAIGLLLSFALLTACSSPAKIDGDTTGTTNTAASSRTGSSDTDPSGTTESVPASSTGSPSAGGTGTGSEPSKTSPDPSGTPAPSTGRPTGGSPGSSGNTGSSGSSGSSGGSSQSGSSGTQTPPPAPTVEKAGKGDEKAVADKVLAYINQFRQEGGVPAATKLPGLTELSEYRSRQLVTNFEHDTHDIREAAAELKYGEYIIPSEWGMTGDPYYEVNAGEAIGMGGWAGSIDTVAKAIASGFRDSAGHWAYVGADPKYQYIAVGVTYNSGMWYCCVYVAQKDLDQLYNYQA